MAATITFKPEVKVLKAAQILNASTEAEWTATNPVIPENMMVYATDTGIIKIGTGTKKYTELPVYYTQGLSEASAHVRFVANIADRDALEDKSGAVMVYDTTDDPTVEDNKMAGYIWDPKLNDEAGGWRKIYENEALDVDLSGYFKKDTDTADSIADGLEKVLMTVEEREALADLVENAVKYTDTVVVQGYNAEELAAIVDETNEEEPGAE